MTDGLPADVHAGSDLLIGVDVGGTKTLALLVATGGPDGQGPLVVDRELGPSGAGDPSVVDGIASAVRALAARAADRGATVAGVGVGLAGFVDPSGIVRSAPNAPGLVDQDVRTRLRSELGVPVVVDNDANCMAVAAHAVIAPDSRHLVAVTFGTGIGGGLVVDGRLVHGAIGFAGEPGHMVVDPDGPLCPCGQRGCWERYASGAGLAWLARRAAEDGRAPSLAAAVGDPALLRGEHVTALVAEGDPGAGAVFDEYAGWVALGLANLIVLLDPQVVVLGGGLIATAAELLPRVEEHLARRFPAATRFRDVRLVASPGGPEAGALGAALLVAAEIWS
jgi:glucokinase